MNPTLLTLVFFLYLSSVPKALARIFDGPSRVPKTYQPTWESIDSRPLPGWYDDSKIGIFVHWGVFSVPSFGNEWFWTNWQGDSPDPKIGEFMSRNYKPGFSYPEFAPQFTAEFYDPDHWADVFKKSGAKYVVLTSKHHEGFTLWPSKTSWNWNAVNVGPKRDVLGLLANATRAKGLKFGLYHSLYEWFNPLYLQDKASGFKQQSFVDEKTMPELYDIVNTYKPEIVWSDGDWEAPDYYWKSKEFIAWLYNDSPIKDTVVTNDRWGQGVTCKHGGFLTCSDRFSPTELQNRKWENAMTIDKNSWGFNRLSNLKDYLTIDELLQTLVSTVTYGGNILINVGPTHDGRISLIMEERLGQLGDWLKVNGQAIYSTNPWNTQVDALTPKVYYTKSAVDSSVYVIFFNWPSKQILSLGSITSTSKELIITLLGGKQLDWSAGTKGELLINVGPYPINTNTAWALKLQNL